jgi:hypothetical protein
VTSSGIESATFRLRFIILDLSTGWRCVVSFTSRSFIPIETHGISWIGGWVGPKAGLDDVEKKKISPLPEIEPLPSSLYLAAIPTELSRLSFGDDLY